VKVDRSPIYLAKKYWDRPLAILQDQEYRKNSLAGPSPLEPGD
jgi:hypothetical protein